MSGGRATIDGVEVEIAPGETILSAARRAGVDIPTVCHREGLHPEGGCRMCVVEVRGEARPVAACHTPIRDGFAIDTRSPEIERTRREVLDLYLSSVPEGALRAAADGSPFEALLARHGLERSSHACAPRTGELRATHPYLRFDPDRCIVCRLCLHVCEDVQGQFVYTVRERGAKTVLAIGTDGRFESSTCTSCGACVEACPTHALYDRDRSATRSRAPEREGERATRSVCGYCGVGCRIEIAARDERVVRIEGIAGAAVNRGHLCAKGRYAHGYQRSHERLTTPLVRRNGTLEPVGWDEAIAWLARRLVEIRDRHGAGALGVFTSARSTNESAYLLQKLFRTAIGTNHVDCCARVCHSSTALALAMVTGTGAASASYEDIERARSIVVAGANPTEAHPVVGARIKQAARRGATLVVIDPRRIELCEWAAHPLQIRPGTNVALFNALAKLWIEEGRFDRAYVEERTEGFAELRALVSPRSLDDLSRICGVSVPEIRAAARAIADAGPTLFVSGLGLSELTQGTASVMTLANLAMLTGSIGLPGAGMLPLRGQNNVQGNADMGGMPDAVTGYQRVDDPEVRARLAREWGVLPPATPGWTISEMIDAAERGDVRALWIQGEDVMQSEPNESHVARAIERLELLVVQDLFLTETARRAHLVLPAAGTLEQDGTYTNGERRIQRVRPAVRAPGEARADWRVVRDVGRALGLDWRYEHPGEVMDEIARVAPRLFGGVSYARLEPDGLQWPCPTPDHPGTATVHAQGFLRGKGRLVAIDHEPSPEHGVAGFPYVLVTGRVLHHYNVGTMTRRTPSRDLESADWLEVHPDDAARERIAEGSERVLESRWGRTRVPVRISSRVAPGTLFLSFHFPETHANRLTGPHVDPLSKCPDYKVTAVRFV
jgi:formate dehydrogenase alpha subunit